MADDNNNGSPTENNRRTNSNLPILFANGYPTSLEKMTAEQLERFVPFLVKSSKNGTEETELSVPLWWSDTVDFKMPLEKPKNFRKNWAATLRKLIEDCYTFFNQPFLLKYSNELCEYDPANLRYVRASDTTTSLYSRKPKKLLLTFRNENMLDKKELNEEIFFRCEMADDNNNGSPTENNRRTNSNLPILFANGYPTSLEKMTAEQLERFVPFLVKSSKNGTEETELSVPLWWSDTVDFKMPLEKPKNFRKVKLIQLDKKELNEEIFFRCEMADDNNNGSPTENNRRTNSNLPILFANGYPTSLEKMTAEQLERFVPFLVKSSKNGTEETELSVPLWWSDTVDFKMPLEKPKNFRKNWAATLRKLIEDCYTFFNQPFLLKYSNELCEYDPANLRYVRASDTTTSLYSRKPKKLLLTFRNENMLYDRKPRMTLWKKHETLTEDTEQETFDIILCDYCDAEFYSDEAYTQHERECGDKAEPELPIIDNIVISDDEDETEEQEEINGQADFMAYFFLASVNADELPRRNNYLMERSFSPKKKRPMPRTRKVISKKERDLEMAIPFSSPAGIALTKKSTVTPEEIEETLAEIEAYCVAKPTIRVVPRVKQKAQSGPENAVIKYMRKPRIYYRPKRTLHSQSREENFQFLNRSLIENLTQCSVTLQKLSSSEIHKIQENFRQIRELKEREKKKQSSQIVDLCSDSDEESIVCDDDVNLSEFHNKLNFPNFAMNSQNSLVLSSNIFQTSEDSSLRPSNKIFMSHRSHSFTTPSTSQNIFPCLSFRNSSSQSYYQFQETIENEGGETNNKRTQRWIQNVNVENFLSPIKPSSSLSTIKNDKLEACTT
ncbi:CLUMA_CG004345, isoform A [Clunio marinus]|uniref:CLUMA_CG004345, isoform A n=1 Tax=Clunio marinus TaxID=568069 RepID=A0A1J1HTD6_9DIPT|nr:CLUMA_CG004345, isoform A [Clunio marinus]